MRSGDVADAALGIRGDLSVSCVASGGGGGRSGGVRETMERLNLAAGGMIAVLLTGLVEQVVTEEFQFLFMSCKLPGMKLWKRMLSEVLMILQRLTAVGVVGG